MSYRIYTDSTASLTDEIINHYNIGIVSLYYYLNDKEHLGYENGQTADMKEFYTFMRTKAKVHTSCATEEAYLKAFKSSLEKGEDVLYIGFSTALSRTCESAVHAAEKLKKEYKNRKIICVSSLCASLGQGKLVFTACEQKENGLSIEENRDYIESKKLKLVHLFTVDDLFYLFRGGRISSLAYKIGSLVKIKPVLHVDNEGRLVPIGKVLSRKKSLSTIADMLIDKIEKPDEQTIFISHGDCMEDVDFLISKIKEKITVKNYVVNYVDPVIGCHSGPGTIAIFFYGNVR